MARYTKGPWSVFNTNGVISILGPKDHEVVSWAGFDATDFPDDTEANAHLIAASPTMAAYIQRRAERGDIEAQHILDEINATS